MKKYAICLLIIVYILSGCSYIQGEPDTYEEVWGNLEQSEGGIVWNELTEEQQSEVNYPTLDENSVYWTPKGGSYHSIDWCYTLSKSKKIINGTIDEAINNGKDNPCSKCVGD